MSFKGPKRGVLLVLLWGFSLGWAAAQIGEPPAQLIRALELEEVALEGSEGERYQLGGLTLDFSLKGAQGALYRVTGGGVLDEAG